MSWTGRDHLEAKNPEARALTRKQNNCISSIMATGATEGKILLKTTTGNIGIQLWPQECPNTNSFNKNSNNKNNKIMIS